MGVVGVWLLLKASGFKGQLSAELEAPEPQSSV